MGRSAHPSSRQAYVNASAWAIDPPTDERPFFFLQLRPADVLRFRAADFGFVSAITVNGVRILLIAVLLAVAVAVVLTAVAIRGRLAMAYDCRRTDGCISLSWEQATWPFSSHCCNASR